MLSVLILSVSTLSWCSLSLSVCVLHTHVFTCVQVHASLLVQMGLCDHDEVGVLPCSRGYKGGFSRERTQHPHKLPGGGMIEHHL